MPTRYTLEVDLKGLVTQEALENSTKRTEARKVCLHAFIYYILRPLVRLWTWTHAWTPSLTHNLVYHPLLSGLLLLYVQTAGSSVCEGHGISSAKKKGSFASCCSGWTSCYSAAACLRTHIYTKCASLDRCWHVACRRPRNCWRRSSRRARTSGFSASCGFRSACPVT